MSGLYVHTHTYCSLGKVYEALAPGGVGYVNMLFWVHGCWGRNVSGGWMGGECSSGQPSLLHDRR